MAHVKLGSAKSANDSINYAAKRAVESSGINCDPDYAKVQFEVTRKLHGKNNGIQAHTIIQSFAPNEITPQRANELGKILAATIAPGFEVAIFTHADKDHIHNHIIINSVHPESGKKYHCHGWDGIESVRHQSNLISAENNLTIPFLPENKRVYGKNARYSSPAPVRFDQKEQAIIEQGKDSWKDEIRQAIDIELKKSKTYEEFKANLEKKYGIMTKDDGKHIVFTHPERIHERDKGRVRGYKLGNDYTKEGIQNGIERQIAKNERKDRAERELGRISNSVGSGKAERQRKKQETDRQLEQERRRIETGHRSSAEQQRQRNKRTQSRDDER